MPARASSEAAIPLALPETVQLSRHVLSLPRLPRMPVSMIHPLSLSPCLPCVVLCCLVVSACSSCRFFLLILLLVSLSFVPSYCLAISLSLRHLSCPFLPSPNKREQTRKEVLGLCPVLIVSSPLLFALCSRSIFCPFVSSCSLFVLCPLLPSPLNKEKKKKRRKEEKKKTRKEEKKKRRKEEKKKRRKE